MSNISVIEDNNYIILQNNIEYIWVKFIQVSKMTEMSIEMFFIQIELGFY